MITFIKLFLLNAVILTGLVFAEFQGALSLIVRNDASYISILIMSLYISMTVFIGILAYKSDVVNREGKDKLLKQSEAAYFTADHMFTLGLLGTIIGLCIATSDSLVDNLSVTEIVAGLKTGLNVSFYTTLCGIVFSLLLQLQLLVLKKDLEE
tara:strand:+ start:1308 stop:1766 length:459 start_codon:yes stop_codon:yes gene_type:complete